MANIRPRLARGAARAASTALASTAAVALLAGLLAGTAAPAAAATCPTVTPTTYVVSPAPSPGVDWSGCDLSIADLTSANLAGANLAGANLSYTLLGNTNLTGANLTGANLTSADLFYPQLDGANLAGATLTGAFSILILGTPTALPVGWRLINGSLVGPGANLSRANVNLGHADLSGADLAGINLHGVNLAGANLAGADLTSATLDSANLSNANLTGANLTGATALGANFTNAVLTNTTLSGTNLGSAILTGVTSGGIVASPPPLLPGWSLVNGFLLPPNVPGLPIVVSVVAGSGQVTIGWTPPAYTGTSPISAYTVVATPGGSSCTTAATTCTVTGLTNGTWYSFTITATNASGNGQSQYANATPAGLPAAPTGPSAVAGVGTATLSWVAPVSDGGSPLTGYRICSSTTPGVSPPGSTCVSGSATTTTRTFTGLTVGSTYYFTVAATTAAGTGPASAVSAGVHPFRAPGPPTNVAVVVSDGLVTITWAAPSDDGGSPITGYHVDPSPSGPSCATTATTCAYSVLTNGTAYTFTVAAQNAGGQGPGVVVAATPMAAPGLPTALHATAGANQVSLVWTAPSANGSPILGYQVCQYYDLPTHLTSTSCTPTSGPASTTVVTGLTPGTTYWYTVAAINVIATGPTTMAVLAVPFSLPSAPTVLTAGLGSQTVKVGWQAPTSTGGSPITGYVVTCTSPPLTPRTASAGVSARSATVNGLTPGATYSCTVAALNAGGAGPSSAPMVVVADRVPGAPTAALAARGDGGLTASWTPPVPNGGTAVVAYSLTCTHLVGGVKMPVTIAAPVSSPLTVTALANGTKYTCLLAATNTLGSGPAVTLTVTPSTPPSAPTDLTATPLPGAATLHWTAPTATGGVAITGYQVTCTSATSVRTLTVAAAVRSVKVALSNGSTYDCTVAAKNAAGIGAAAPAVTTTPHAAPTAPTHLTVAAGGASATLTFTAPTGAVTGTSYTATCTSNVAGAATPLAATDTTTSLTVTGLTAGDLYSCTVKATNAFGTSPGAAPRTVTPN